MNHFFIKNEINIGMSNADRDCTAGLQQNPTIMPLRPAFRLVAYKVVVTHEVLSTTTTRKWSGCVLYPKRRWAESHLPILKTADARSAGLFERWYPSVKLFKLKVSLSYTVELGGV